MHIKGNSENVNEYFSWIFINSLAVVLDVINGDANIDWLHGCEKEKIKDLFLSTV